MSFNFAPWAVDGARTSSSLARISAFVTGGARSGVAKPDALRVLPLSVPGNGLRIMSGAAAILNLYQSDPDEMYIVSNPALHTVLAADMPAPQASLSYYLVCVVVGDPEFNQTGHPFMPSEPLAPEVAADYEYVRVVIIPCSAGTTRFSQLGYDYPAVELARLEIPANTTTITGAMITDLRSLSQGRQESHLLSAQPVHNATSVPDGDYKMLGNFAPFIEMPSWATHVEIMATVSGITHVDPQVAGQVRISVSGLYSAPVYYEYAATGGAPRETLSLTYSAEMSANAGTNLQLSLQINRLTGTGELHIYEGTTVVFDVRFSERIL